jgi:AcrR family transcriptional regulator
MNPATTPTKPAPLEPRPMRADARRNHERVLDAAYDVFAEHGLEAQIDEIAHRAGVGVGTVYRHFPAKEDLLAALADRKFAWMAGRARQALAEDDAWEALCNFVRDAAGRTAEDIAIADAMGSRPEMMGAAAERAGMLELLDQLVSRAQAQGAAREDVTGSDLPMVFCALGSVAKAGTALEFMRWDRLVEVILDGLAAPKPTPLP